MINGGPVTATSASIVNLTINSGGSLVFPSGGPSILDITGTNMVNNGSISLAGSDGLEIEGNTTVTLSGSGSVTMAGNRFWGGNGSPTLIVQQPVQGEGTFSLGLNLTNQNLINATGGTLFMQPNSSINTGTMEASSGSTLTFNNGSPVAYNNTGGVIQALNGGTVQLENGVYTGGTLTTSGSGVIQAMNSAVLNTLTNSGTLQVPNGQDATLEGTITNTNVIQVPSSTLATSGNVTLSGAGSLLMSGSAILKQLGATDTLTNQQLIHGSGTIFQLPLSNKGTIAADANSNTLALSGGTINNTSILEATQGGTLEIGAVINNTGGIIKALPGSTVILTNNSNGSVNGGTLTTSGTGVIESQNVLLDGTINVPTNAGRLNVNSFDLFLQGTINNTGTIVLSGSSCVILNQPSKLTGTGKLILASTSCIYGAGIPFTNQSNILGAGTIGDSNPMPITNQGTISANQASPLAIVPDASGFTNNGVLSVLAGSRMNINGLFNNLPSGGTLTGGIYTVSGTLAVQNAIVNNNAKITLTGAAAQIISTNTSVNALAMLSGNGSAGSLTMQNGQILTTSGNLSNAGKITVKASSGLSVGGSFTQTGGTSTVDGILTAPTGLALQKGSLMGQGTLAAAVTSSATVVAGDSTSKAGKLTVTGSYTQNANGVLDIAIGGTLVGTQYSQVAVSNGASLNGTLNLKRINGFFPSIGQKFTILTASALSGEFATVTGLSINSAEHFEVSYSSTAVTLTVVSG